MVNGSKGFDSAFTVIDYYKENDLIIYSAYQGVDTDTYSKYRRTLESNISQMMKYIIVGDKPLSYFDQTVNTLRNGMSKTILEEINKVRRGE